MDKTPQAPKPEQKKLMFLKSVVSPVDKRVEMGLPKMCRNSFYGN